MIVSICESPDLLKVLRLVRMILMIIRIIVPLILMISVMIELVKIISNGKLDTISKSMVNKVLAALLIFLIPSIIYFIVSVVDPNNTTFISCLNSATSEKIEELYNEHMEELMNEARSNPTNTTYSAAYNYLKNIEDEDKREEYKKELENIKELIKGKSTPSKEEEKNENVPNPSKSQTYNLSDSDLQYIANVGYCEQGYIDGIKAEASLAVNHFELQSKYSTIVEYIKKSGWFACSTTDEVASSSAVEAVRDVIANGNRTLPVYIDEHDCADCTDKTCSNGNRGDICKIVTNGITYESMSEIKNHSNYISGKTVIYNRYGSVYTFYTFPCESCDPFGYTADSYNKYNK